MSDLTRVDREPLTLDDAIDLLADAIDDKPDASVKIIARLTSMSDEETAYRVRDWLYAEPEGAQE